MKKGKIYFRATFGKSHVDSSSTISGNVEGRRLLSFACAYGLTVYEVSEKPIRRIYKPHDRPFQVKPRSFPFFIDSYCALAPELGSRRHCVDFENVLVVCRHSFCRPVRSRITGPTRTVVLAMILYKVPGRHVRLGVSTDEPYGTVSAHGRSDFCG